jgi:hypothetical protein
LELGTFLHGRSWLSISGLKLGHYPFGAVLTGIVGNSYLTEFLFDAYKVKKVCGVAGDKSNLSIKNTEVSLRPSTKIIQGDWIWHANRNVNNKRHIWHN